jgi:hypothetical protein
MHVDIFMKCFFLIITLNNNNNCNEELYGVSGATATIYSTREINIRKGE